MTRGSYDRITLRNNARTFGSFIIPPKPLQSSVVVWLVTVCERHLGMVAPPAPDVRAEADQRVRVDRRGRRVEAEPADRARDRLADPRGESVEHHAEARIREMDRRVAREHGVAFRVLAHVGEERAQPALEQLARLAGRRERVAHRGLDARDLGVHHRFEQALLVAEVAVHDRPGDARALRDLLERGRLEAALREHPAGNLQELAAALRARQAGIFFCGHR